MRFPGRQVAGEHVRVRWSVDGQISGTESARYSSLLIDVIICPQTLVQTASRTID
jgi:hypothetical protein